MSDIDKIVDILNNMPVKRTRQWTNDDVESVISDIKTIVTPGEWRVFQRYSDEDKATVICHYVDAQTSNYWRSRLMTEAMFKEKNIFKE